MSGLNGPWLSGVDAGDENDSIPDATGDCADWSSEFERDGSPKVGSTFNEWEYCELCGRHGQALAADSIYCEACEKLREQEGQ